MSQPRSRAPIPSRRPRSAPELPVRARRRPRSRCASSDAARRASRCTQRAARASASAPLPTPCAARVAAASAASCRARLLAATASCCFAVFSVSEVVLAFLRHSREVVEVRHRVVEDSSSRGGSRSARRCPPRRAHEAAARASARRLPSYGARCESGAAGLRAPTPATARDRAGLRAVRWRLRADDRLRTARAPRNAIELRSGRRACAATRRDASDWLRRTPVPPPLRTPGRQAAKTAAAACVPAQARGADRTTVGKEEGASRRRKRHVCAVSAIDARPWTLLRSRLVTHRPLPVRPSRPRSGGRHS